MLAPNGRHSARWPKLLARLWVSPDGELWPIVATTARECRDTRAARNTDRRKPELGALPEQRLPELAQRHDYPVAPSLTRSMSRTAPGIIGRAPSFTRQASTFPSGKPLFAAG
jgi:hypothetical protein